MGYIPLYKEHKRGNEMAKYAKIQKNIDGKERYSITPQIPGGYITPENLIKIGEVAKKYNASLKVTSAQKICIGNLKEEDIDIISPLDVYVSHANLIIHPYLGLIKNTDNLNLNESEVDHVFLVPLNYLLDYDVTCYTNDVKVIPKDDFPYNKIPNKENYKFAQGDYPVWFYEYKNYEVNDR